mgnify:FL=1
MDNRECYIDKLAKDAKGEPLKRWYTKEGFKNLMEVDKNRLIKKENIKVTVPKEYANVVKDQSNKSENGKGVRNGSKRGAKIEEVSNDTQATDEENQNP